MSYETVLNGKIESTGGSSSDKYYTWMLDYKTYGEDSYVFQDKAIWKEFMESPIAINDNATSALALDWAINQGGHAGKVIGSMYGMSQTPNWNSLATLQDICNNQPAFHAVMDLPTAANAVFRRNNYECMSYHSDVVYNEINSRNDILTELLNSDKYKNSKVTKIADYSGYCILLSATNNTNNSQRSWRPYNYGDEIYATIYVYARSGVKYVSVSNQEVVVISSAAAGGGIANGSLTEGSGATNPYSKGTYTVNKIVKSVSFMNISNYKYIGGKGFWGIWRDDTKTGTDQLYQGNAYHTISVSGGSFIIIPL